MPPQPVTPITPARATPNLLTSTLRRGDWGDWSAGISFSSSCPQAATWPHCQDDTEEEKAAAGERSPVTFLPVTVYVPMACEWVADPAGFDTEAQAAVDAGSSAPVAAALQSGVTDHGDTDNASLVSSATAIAGGPVSPGVGIGRLLAEFGACTTGIGRPLVHAPLELGPYLVSRRLMWPDGEWYSAAGGARVVADAGYDATLAPTGEDPAPDGEAWIYISGPVEYDLGPTRALTAEDTRRRNIHDVIAEREAIYRFDPCCVFATLVTVPDEWGALEVGS